MKLFEDRAQRNAAAAASGRNRDAAASLKGARVAVAGMARSGLAAAGLLAERGAVVIPVDKNTAPLFKLHLVPENIRRQTAEAFADADLIVLSPGVPADLEELGGARERGVPVIGELELAGWFLEGAIIGITGSNGKTTTTALTGHILASCGIPAQVGGNIGTPPCSMVASSRADQWNVLELSSFQLETIQRFRAHVGACLNITPDHLDRHYTLERYAAAKARLFENQTAEDFAVLNADDPITRDLAKSTKAQVLWFSSKEPFAGAGGVPLRGLHNLDNATAAALIARQAGAADDQIREAIKSFPGVEHRLEFVRELGGVAWYNDSKATNVDAAIKAIEAFPGRLWVILGGRDKNSDYTPLGPLLKDKAHGALLIGEAAAKIEQQLRGNVPAVLCVKLDEAVSEARARARARDTVLLAPACASFDQFDNFEHRGREFKRLVREL